MQQKAKASPAERMLIELALADYEATVAHAEKIKNSRIAKVFESHPEAKIGLGVSSEGGEMYVLYETDDTVPPKP